MAKLPSRFRRLDEILADLPVDDPILLTELDGYLTGIIVAPEPSSMALWLPRLWGGAYGEAPPFEHPVDAKLFGDMMLARHNEIERELARAKFQPIYDADERTGELVWEDWVGGFEMAMALHPESWSAAAGGDQMRLLADVAFDRSALTGAEINDICDRAPGMIAEIVTHLYSLRIRPEAAAGADEKLGKVGRNDPCPCGSGKKHKRCCGAAA
jgi:uncharacterized protein